MRPAVLAPLRPPVHLIRDDAPRAPPRFDVIRPSRILIPTVRHDQYVSVGSGTENAMKTPE
jgi:hypothetical protein